MRTSSARGFRMSVIALIGTAVMVSLTACGESTQAASSAANTTSSSAQPTSSQPTSSQPTAAPVQKATVEQAVAPQPQAAKVLGPFGYGKLRLGMTEAQAKATGQAVGFVEPAPGACRQGALTDQGPKTDQNYVMVSAKQGLAAISVTSRSVHTTEGIGIGATIAQVKAAYPEIAGRFDDELFAHLHRIGVPVHGNPSAVYRMVFNDGSLTQLAIQNANQDCYE